jgi:hypothetical protein
LWACNHRMHHTLLAVHGRCQPRMGALHHKACPGRLACSWPCASMCAVNPPAVPLFTDPVDVRTTTMGTPISGNVLDNAALPSGMTAQVTGFTVAGSSTVYRPGTPVSLTDPTSGQPVGTILMQADGNYTFMPAPGFFGPVPTLNLYERRSDGATTVSALDITVTPCEYDHVPAPCGLSRMPPRGALLLCSCKHASTWSSMAPYGSHPAAHACHALCLQSRPSRPHPRPMRPTSTRPPLAH